MSAEREALGAGEGLTPLELSAGLVLQLQAAFSRGLLKPGLNVVLEGPKKAVNDVVSSGARSGGLRRDIGTRNCCAWATRFLF